MPNHKPDPPTSEKVTTENAIALTPRQTQVLILMTRGLSLKEIAFALGITYLTVKEYTRHIYARLHVNNRVSAVMWAVQTSLIPSGPDHSSASFALPARQSQVADGSQR